MPPKEQGRINSNVDTASQHPDRSTVTSVAKPTSLQPTATTTTTAGEEAHRVEFLSLPDSAQPSEKTKLSQSASQQQQVVSRQLKKFLVTCLVVAGVGWLLAVVGICTDHWLSVSLKEFGHSVTEGVNTVNEAVDTVTEAVSDGGVVTNAVNTVAEAVTDTLNTVRPGEVTQTADVTDVVTTRKPSPGKHVIEIVVDNIGNTAGKVEGALEDGVDAVVQTADALIKGNKSVDDFLDDAEDVLEDGANAVQDFFSGWLGSSLGTDRVPIGLFHCGMDCNGWMMGVQTLILTGFLLATAGMVVVTLPLVLKNPKPWMPTVGGVSCLIGGIFTINGVIASFLTTPYFDEPEWSFLVTFIGGLLFMVAGVLVLLLERYDRIQSRSEGKRSV